MFSSIHQDKFIKTLCPIYQYIKKQKKEAVITDSFFSYIN